MDEIRKRMVGVKFVGMELYYNFRCKRWLLIFLLIGVYVILTESNFIYTFGVNQNSLNFWQLIMAVLAGPSFHPPIFRILGWSILPSAFILGIGEPFSLLQMQWMKVLLSRIPTRWDYWWGRLIAWYVMGFLFVVFVIGVSLVVSGMMFSPDRPKIPLTLILNGKVQSFQTVLAWGSFNLLTTIWWYITILITFSTFISRPPPRVTPNQLQCRC